MVPPVINFHSRLRFFALTVSIALVVVAVLFVFIEFFLFARMEASQRRQMENLAGTVGIACQKGILSDDRAALAAMLEEMMSSLAGDAGLRYLIIQDRDTSVLAEAFDGEWPAQQRAYALRRLRTVRVPRDTAARTNADVQIDESQIGERERAALREGSTGPPAMISYTYPEGHLPAVISPGYTVLVSSTANLVDVSLPIAAGRIQVGGLRLGFVDRLPLLRRDIRVAFYTIAVILTIVAGGLALLVAGGVDARFQSEHEAQMEAAKREADERVKKTEALYMRKEEDNPITPSEFLTLLDFARMITATLNYNEVLEIGIKTCLQIMNIHDCSIFVLDPTTNELSGRIGHDENGFMEESEMSKIRVPVGKGDIGVCAEFGTTASIDTPRPGTAVVSALVSRGRTIGVVLVKNKISGRPFIKKDQMLLRIFTSMLANAMENAAIFHHLSQYAPAPAEPPAEG